MAEVHAGPAPLWPNNIKIEVIGATGEYQSGKSVLGLTLAPGFRPDGACRTKAYDIEKSLGTYNVPGVERVDVPERMYELTKGGDYKPLDLFRWWLGDIRSIKKFQYDVIHVDPITDLEAGMVEWIKANCDQYGYTRNQLEKGGGILWGLVKGVWKSIIADLATRCQTFYYTAHLRDQFNGATPTGKREPKGKDTLMELSSLYLWLERKAITEGAHKGEMQVKPSANVLKSRLAANRINPETGELEFVPLLPPRLPEATRAAIVKYLQSPPDYTKLAPEEQYKPEEVSEEAKKLIDLRIAEANATAETNALAKLNRAAELRAMAAGGKPAVASVAPVATTPAPDMSAANHLVEETRRKLDAARAADSPKEEPTPEPTPEAAPAAVAEPEAAPQLVDQADKEQLASLLGECIKAKKMTKEQLFNKIEQITGAKDPARLTKPQCKSLVAVMEKLVGKK